MHTLQRRKTEVRGRMSAYGISILSCAQCPQAWKMESLLAGEGVVAIQKHRARQTGGWFQICEADVSGA